jgi:hypothetical protein
VPLLILFAGAPAIGGLLPLFSGREPKPLRPAMSTPLSSFPFFLISAFKLINIYVYKSSKSEGVSSAKEISNQWNGI